MSDTVVHILLPTCEPRPDFLRAAIDSVTTQTEQRWMLHINDDASTVDVHAIVAPYLQDPRISFSRNPRRLGIGGNWNACLQSSLSPRLSAVASAKVEEEPACSSSLSDLGVEDRQAGVGVRGSPPYIQFLFQDDLWNFGYLACALRIMEEHPTVGFVSTEHEYDCEKGIATAALYDELQRFRRERIAPGIHRGKDLLQWWLERGLHPNIVGEPSFVLLRRSLVTRVGIFDRTMSQYLDVEYWTRCLMASDWYCLNENLGTFRVHQDGASERNRRGNHGLYDRLHTIERVLRCSGKNRREQAPLLARAAAQMIRRRLATPQENRPRAMRHLPLLSFVLRHPIVTVRAAGQALRKSSP